MEKQETLYKLQIAALNAICTMSDDEGPGNLADMDRWWISFEVYNGLMDGGTELIRAEELYHWEDSGETTVDVGYNWAINQEATVTFTDGGDKYNIANATLKINVRAREYDSMSADEYGEASLQLTGIDKIMGNHMITVASADFAFDVHFRVSAADPVFFLKARFPGMYQDLLAQGWEVRAGDKHALKDVKADGAIHCVDGREYIDEAQPNIMRGPKVQGGVLGVAALLIKSGSAEGIKNAVQKVQAAGYIAAVHGDEHNSHADHGHPAQPANGCGFALKWYAGALATLKSTKLEISPEAAKKIVMDSGGQFVILPGDHTEKIVRLNFVEDKTYEPDGTAFNLDVWFADTIGMDAEALMRNAADTVLTLLGHVIPIEVVV